MPELLPHTEIRKEWVVYMSENKIVAEVRKLAEERPDHVYVSEVFGQCSYVGAEIGRPNESGGCIIGQALIRTGVSETELAEWETGAHRAWGPDSTVDMMQLDHPGWLGEPSEADMDWLLAVQGKQDRGDSWADAVRLTDQGF